MGKVHLSGQLICDTEAQAAIVRTHVDTHIALTRAEDGCESFEITQGNDPMVWQVDETFHGQAAFDAHQTRTMASEWGRVTAGIRRDFKISGGD